MSDQDLLRELAAAEANKAELLSDWNSYLYALAGLGDEVAAWLRRYQELQPDYTLRLQALPDAIAAGPPLGLLQELADRGAYLLEIIGLLTDRAAHFLEAQPEFVATLRRLHSAVQPSEVAEEVEGLFAAAGQAIQTLSELTTSLAGIYEEMRVVSFACTDLTAEAHAVVMAELGPGPLAELLFELRSSGEQMLPLVTDLVGVLGRYQQAQQDVGQRLPGLEEAVAWVQAVRRALAAPSSGDPREEIRTLSAALPLILLPVRLETRVEGATPLTQAVLKVRIYPDAIGVDTHDQVLTEAEWAAGQGYWEQLWSIPPGRTGPGLVTQEEAQQAEAARQAEEALWRGLLRYYPAERAAWIVQATQPLNLDERPMRLPQFPPPTIREQQWTRAAQASGLPDRWVVVAFRGRQLIKRAVSRPVRKSLALSPILAQPLDNAAASSVGALGVDDQIAWMFDFQAALEAGMAVTVPLNADDEREGFDLILVFGVKASLAPEDGRQQLEALLAAHHYTEGLVFVPPGTPTNNTSAAPSGFPALDPDGSASFGRERLGQVLTQDSDGARLAHALGIEAGVVGRIAGAERTSHRFTWAMNRALWPATLGYFMQQMMPPIFDVAAIQAARDYFVRYVRGGGPLPAFRVGPTPYGLLPVTSLRRWKPRAADDDNVARPLAAGLRLLQSSVWSQQIGSLPRIGRRPDDPDRDLLEVLGMDASAREVRMRYAIGPQFQDQLVQALHLNRATWLGNQANEIDKLVVPWNRARGDPRLLHLLYYDQTFRLSNPLVTAELLSESAGLAPGANYIAGIRTASIADLKDHNVEGAKPPALLYLLLRYAALCEVVDQARQGELQQEDEIYNPGDLTIWDDIAQAASRGPLNVPPEFYDALGALQPLPTAELERLSAETLDLCSHRLDAWITSLATKRLEELRSLNSLGCHLGAFGWVENLRPGPPPVSPGGYIHAPSMDHAAAAAILRNAFLTRAGPWRAPYAINLSSARVRAALWLLDNLRQGQPLGALLGYRFERGLHELGLDQHIDHFRATYPLLAGKPVVNRADGPEEPTAAVAARNVVDGLALRAAWHQRSMKPFPWPGGLGEQAIQPLMATLDDAVDAVADLLLAESVYQSVRGNMSAAAASLDALAQGVRPPAPEVVDPPRGGIPLTHRVGLALGGEPLAAEAWGVIPPTPRAQAEPCLDAWVGSLLGDPRQVICRAYACDPASGRPLPGTERIVSLVDLQLRPLDVLALAPGVYTQAAASELDQCIALQVPRGEAAAVNVAIDYALGGDRDRQTFRSFPDILELAQAVQALLGAARPLRPEDLLEPEVASAMPEETRQAYILANEAWDRATAAQARLQEAITRLESAPSQDETRQALLSASLFGVPAALAWLPEEELPAQVEAVHLALRERLRRAQQGTSPTEIVQAIFGPGFLLLPHFRLVAPDRIAAALEAGPQLVGEDPDAVWKWLQQAARARPALGRWRMVALYSQALGARPMAFDLAQLPPEASSTWAALPFGQGEPPRSGLVSLALHRPAAAGPDDTWAGVLLDEWTELIPNRSEITGVAFHYNSPGAEAPQAVLIAVPPDDASTWDEDTLIDILRETFQLAQLRLVDRDLLGALGQLLPGIFLAGNLEGDTLTFDCPITW